MNRAQEAAPSLRLTMPAVRVPWHALGLVVAVLVIGGPDVFTQNGFAYDFTNHMWLVWVQEQAISHHLLPTYFVNSPATGVFYPLFVFYGGTLYAASGAVSALLGGHVILGYVGVTLLAVAASYGGLVWLSRQLGVRGWMAHAPAVAFVASAYYVTNLYGRGAWPEFMATSAIPLLIASGYRLARAPRVEALPAILFVLSAVIFAGSHNVTLLLGCLVLGAALLLLWLALGRELAPHGLRRLLVIAGLLVLAVGVDAWFLIPDLVHASDTQVGGGGLVRWKLTGFFNTPEILFNPLRAVPHQSTTRALYVQAPDWFMLWVLAAGVGLWTRAERRLRRAGLALVLLLAGLLALIMVGPLWDSMPRIVREVQFPYRLNTYVALCVAGLVLVCARGIQQAGSMRGRRLLTLGLAAATAISLGLCIWQLWVPSTHQGLSYTNRHQVFVSTHVTPRTWYDTGEYNDASQRVVGASNGTLRIDPFLITSDHVSLTVFPPPGSGAIVTNIGGGPDVVTLSGGVTRVGRTALGLSVVRRVDGRRGPVRLTLARAGWSLTTGLVVSVVALVILLAALGCVAGIRIADLLAERSGPRKQRDDQ